MKKLASILLLSTSVCFGQSPFKLIITPDEIEQKISEVAIQLNADYKGEELTLIMVMKGAICVAADLIRHLEIPCRLEYMQASSYRGGTEGSKLVLTGVERLDIASKNVLIVDDIFDTGNTMTKIVDELKKMDPKSLKTLVLLSKKGIARKTSYAPDYVLFHIDNQFVIGYGLDYQEFYRGLPGIYAMVETP
jgi:hypoxanthine phosphoribosyltransferase